MFMCWAGLSRCWFDAGSGLSRHHMSSVNRPDRPAVDGLNARNELWSVLLPLPVAVPPCGGLVPHLAGAGCATPPAQSLVGRVAATGVVAVRPARRLAAMHRGLRAPNTVAAPTGASDEARPTADLSAWRARRSSSSPAARPPDEVPRLLRVRDEADIVGQCLDHLLAGPMPSTCSIRAARTRPGTSCSESGVGTSGVACWGRDPVYFSETRLRGWMFHQARAHMRDGDWFLRVDADEFHHVPPPEFVRTRLAAHETIVFHQYYDFGLTASRCMNGRRGARLRAIATADRAAPSLLHREPVHRAAPVPLPGDHALAAHRVLPVQRRLSGPRSPPDPSLPAPRPGPARAALPPARGDDGRHGEPPQLVAPGRASLVGGRLADLHRARRPPRSALLAAGVAIARVHFANHLAKPHVRAAQRVAHACLLPVLDRLRPRYPDQAYPRRIPTDATQRIDAEFREHVVGQSPAAVPA